MKIRSGYRWWLQDQSGGTLLLVTFSLVILLGIAAFAIDFGFRHVTRNELQNIADGAALAGARQLGMLYHSVPFEDHVDYDPYTMDSDSSGNTDSNQIIVAAQAVGTSNTAALQPIAILASEVEIFQRPGSLLVDAVRVKARRDTTANSPITTFLSHLIGTDTMNVTATATAALTGQSTSADGEVELPLAISEYFFDYYSSDPDGACGHEIQTSPTGVIEGCAGWDTYAYYNGQWNTNDNTLINIIESAIEDTDPEYPSQGVTVGDPDASTYAFIGGELGNGYDALLTLFEHRGCDVDSSGECITDPAYAIPLCVSGGGRQNATLL